MSFHDDRPVGWVNPNTGVRFAKVHQFRCAMDNHEPCPRRVSGGVLEEWQNPDGTLSSYRLMGWGDERDAHKAVYVVDDGRTVGVFYVAGFSKLDAITLHPFPTNVHADGTPKIGGDGRPVDHSNWMQGPVRMYHLKIIRH